MFFRMNRARAFSTNLLRSISMRHSLRLLPLPSEVPNGLMKHSDVPLPSDIASGTLYLNNYSYRIVIPLLRPEMRLFCTCIRSKYRWIPCRIPHKMAVVSIDSENSSAPVCWSKNTEQLNREWIFVFPLAFVFLWKRKRERKRLILNSQVRQAGGVSHVWIERG